MRNRSHTGASIKFLRRVKFVAGLAPMGGGGCGRGVPIKVVHEWEEDEAEAENEEEQKE